MSEIRRLMSEIRKRNESLDREIQLLQQERTSLARAWRPREETQARLDQVINAAAERYSLRLKSIIAKAADPDTLPGLIENPLSGNRPGNIFDPDSLAYFFGEQLKEGIAKGIDVMKWRGMSPDNDDGLPVDKRAQPLAKLDAKIAELTLEREALRNEINSLMEV